MNTKYVNMIAATVLLVTPFRIVYSANINDPLEIGFSPLSGTLLLRVTSTGCTARDDFTFLVDDQNSLSVKRTKPDRCRAAPKRVQFEYTFNELGFAGPVFISLGRET